jgi:hypothetical protein
LLGLDVLLVGVVGVAKVVEHRDGLDDAVDGLLAKGGDAGCHDCHSTGQVMSQLVIERANTLSSRVHVDSPFCLDESQAQFSRHAEPRGRYVEGGCVCDG